MGDASTARDKVRGGTRNELVCSMEVATFPFQRGGMEGWLQRRLSTVAPATRAPGQTSSVAVQGWKSSVPTDRPETACPSPT